MDRSVSKVHDQLSQKRDPQEVDFLVRTPRRTGESSEALFVCLSSAISRIEVQFTQIRESAGFTRRYSVGMHYRTIHDLGDGFGDRTAACREYTLLRDDPQSKIKL